MATTPDLRTRYPVLAERVPAASVTHGRYRMRFAHSVDDLDAILRLRFQVFNVELGEGLETSHQTGRDQDAFDAVCHHLMIEDVNSDRVVGTYRMQTDEMASAHRGFYSAGEFDLASLPPDVLDRSVEVGRACVAREYRHRTALFLLWRGLAAYMRHNRKRHLFGCCSLTSQDPAVGLRALAQLEAGGHVHPDFRVSPLPGLECGEGEPLDRQVTIPILFKTYLRYGAKVCGPPAIDRQFKTIDFLVTLDVEALDSDLRRLYFSS